MLDFNTAPRQRPERYMPPPPPPSDPIEAFQGFMAGYGLNPGAIVPSGKLQRFDVEKKNDKAGWYVFFHGEICGAAFGNWKSGHKYNWCSRDTRALSDAQAADYQRMVREASQIREKEQQRLNMRAKKSAHRIWEKATIPSGHPYLANKQVPAIGIKQSEDMLIVPAKDQDGELWTLQRIFENGDKKFLFGGEKKGLFFTIPGNGQLYICEGYATGATIHQATGGTVIVAFDAGNLKRVAKAIRKKHPTASITICADNDILKPGNPGVTKAESAGKEINAMVVVPQFEKISEELSDFNDLARSQGIKAVQAQLVNPHEKRPFPPLSAARTCVATRLMARPAPIEFIFKFNDSGLIPKGVVGVLTATGGTGKTFFLLGLAHAAATGGNMGPINAPQPIRTLALVGEDTQDELDRRLWDIAKGQFPDLLHACSVYGEVGPLMRLDGNIPTRADGFKWLEETIQGHPGLELLILDPKSRFYGLDENNSDHSTQWIQSLEYLAKKYELTILFSHHTSKDNGDKLSQNMSRGSSAIVDGCRWQGGIVRMDKNAGARFGIKEYRQYIEFDAPKSNYSEDIPESVYFKRGPGGVLQYADLNELRNYRYAKIAKKLAELLRQDPVNYSKDELVERPLCNSIVDDIKDDFPDFVRMKEMKNLLDYMLEKDLLTELKVPTKGRPRYELVPR